MSERTLAGRKLAAAPTTRSLRPYRAPTGANRPACGPLTVGPSCRCHSRPRSLRPTARAGLSEQPPACGGRAASLSGSLRSSRSFCRHVVLTTGCRLGRQDQSMAAMLPSAPRPARDWRADSPHPASREASAASQGGDSAMSCLSPASRTCSCVRRVAGERQSRPWRATRSRALAWCVAVLEFDGARIKGLVLRAVMANCPCIASLLGSRNCRWPGDGRLSTQPDPACRSAVARLDRVGGSACLARGGAIPRAACPLAPLAIASTIRLRFCPVVVAAHFSRDSILKRGSLRRDLRVVAITSCRGPPTPPRREVLSIFSVQLDQSGHHGRPRARRRRLRTNSALTSAIRPPRTTTVRRMPHLRQCAVFQDEFVLWRAPARDGVQARATLAHRDV